MALSVEDPAYQNERADRDQPLFRIFDDKGLNHCTRNESQRH